MFYLFRNWVIEWESERELKKKWCVVIEKESFTQEESEKLYNWCLFQKWKIIVTNQYKTNIEEVEKKETILKYQGLQKDIQEIKWEIQDYEETYEDKNEQWKALAKMRVDVLKTRLLAKRNESDLIALEWVEKFWSEVMNEF